MTVTTVEENKRIAREHFHRVWQEGEFDTDVLADDYHVVLNLGGRDELTREEFQAMVTESRDAIPDMRKEPDEVIATDEKVVIRYSMTGTPEREVKGIPATGESVEIAAVAIYRVEGGKLAKEWYIADFLRALKQLGVVEPGE